jgi:hypothetical protein
MPNEYAIIIEGYHVKEVRCKNDSCRALLGWENTKIGVQIYKCRCNTISVFNFQYKAQGRDLIDKLQNKFGEGGEK